MIRMSIRTNVITAFLSAAVLLVAQSDSGRALSAGEIVDRVISVEAAFGHEMSRYHPVIETYLQYTEKGPDGKDTVTGDAYFIGKLDLTAGFGFDSFVPEKSGGFRFLSPLRKSDNFRLLPQGFVKMATLDPASLNRGNYVFENVHSEFVGEVRCWVLDVTPREKEGRFIGRIWAEDRDFHIVRYSGTYGSKQRVRYFHFNGYRQQVGPGLWLPASVYVEHSYDGVRRKSGLPGGLRAQVHLWSYGLSLSAKESSFTNIQVETPEPAKDRSATDVSTTEALREWKREAEENVLRRMEKAGLIAPAGEMEKVLDAVLNNLVVTNKIVTSAPLHCRILLTMPLESCAIGNSIVLSRGLIDVLPNEATLAAVIARELAHVLQANDIKTLDAFGNRVQVDDKQVLQQFSFRRTPEQEASANQKAEELLRNSPYNQELPSVGLFLVALGMKMQALPNLIKANVGNPIADNGRVVLLRELAKLSPFVTPQDVRQIPALSLASRLRIDAWDNKAEIVNAKPVAILTADEKLPFEVTPIVVPLRRQGPPTAPVPSK